jgi:hypothetical protein
VTELENVLRAFGPTLSAELRQKIAQQPPKILQAIAATHKYISTLDVPVIDPDKLTVLVALCESNGCVQFVKVPFERVKADIEKPVADQGGLGGDPKLIPVLARARKELLEKRKQGASQGFILWAMDDEQNYFMVAIGKVFFNARGGVS